MTEVCGRYKELSVHWEQQEIIIRKLMDGNDQVGRPRKLRKMAIIIIKISMNKNLLLAGKIGSCHLDQLIFIAI